MSEGAKPKKKLSFEETMRRMRPFYLLMMMFPLVGMVAAMIIVYMIQARNLLLIEALLFFSMVFFVGTTYLFYRQMGQLVEKERASTSAPN